MLASPGFRFAARLALLSVLIAGCTSRTSHGVIERTGPPFPQAFPDARVLLETDDVAGVRERLARAILPATDEHHDQLRALLASVDAVDTQHLVLLTEAVALPGPADEGMQRITISVDGETARSILRTLVPRGSGEYAAVVDELLLAGLDKLTDLDRSNLGLILGRTQFDETMGAIVDRTFDEFDDGSPQALEQILAGMEFSGPRVDLVTAVLAPRDMLAAASGRGLVAVRSVDFDNQREQITEVVMGDLETLSAEGFLEYLELMSFDTGRLVVTRLSAPRLEPRDGSSLLRILDLYSFDSGRVEALDVLTGDGRVQVTPPDFNRLLGSMSFDTGRMQVAGQLDPHLQGQIDVRTARDTLEAFSFDTSRLEVLELLAPRLKHLGQADRAELFQAYSFDSNKERAGEILDA